jgi:hypothetical protein
MMKLLHCPEFSNKVTSDMEDVKWSEPILGKNLMPVYIVICNLDHVNCWKLSLIRDNQQSV